MPLAHRLEYRSEIDGLRAVAVLAVVAFHAGFGCPGGYVGVDVFFVISGFLITSLICRDLEQGRFSLAGFWERRARRIVPAWAVVTLATLAAGWLALMPEDFEDLGEASLAQALLMANIHYWQHSGYFSGASEIKPLLHTWSLAVEEQFYLVMPLVLYGVYRATRMRRQAAIALLVAAAMAASLTLSGVGVIHFPSATFYLLPTRAWELLAGSLLAVLPSWGWFDRSRALREAGGVAGLALIALPVCFYTPSTPFPGPAAALPCLGGALLLAATRRVHGSPLPLAGRLLSNRLLVFVGMISYSLYLWHWPLLALSRYRSAVPLSASHRAGLLALSFLCAILSWWFVERPFRQRSLAGSRRAIFALAGSAAAAMALAGVLCSEMDGFPQRLPRQAQVYASAKTDRAFVHDLSVEDARQGKLLPIGSLKPGLPPQVLVWGDSHAMAVLPALDAYLKELGLAGRAATHSSTPPVLDWYMVSRHGLGEASLAFNESVFAFIRRHRIAHVILSARWRSYLARGDRLAMSFQRALLGTIRRLVANGSQPWILLDVPNHTFNVPVTLARSVVLPTDVPALCARPDGSHRLGAIDPGLLARIRRAGGRIIDPKPRFLDPSGRYYMVQWRGVALYRDEHHLAATGARMMLVPLFREALILGSGQGTVPMQAARRQPLVR